MRCAGRARALDEARAILDRCREVYKREHDLAGPGMVFGALSIIETRLGHHDDARQLDERYQDVRGHALVRFGRPV